MDLKLSGKLALVTGASRGIGRSVATCLAREGCQVIGVSRTLADLETLKHDLKSYSRACGTIQCDLTVDGSPSELLNSVQQSYGVPDIVVHNLGGTLDVTDPLCSVDDFRKVLRFNLEIPIEINRRLIPSLQKRKFGRICHVASIAALENQGPPSYCAAKAALTAYVRSVGRYVSKDNVIMTTVLPGPVMTQDGYWDNVSKQRPEHLEKFLSERVAIGRLAEPDEIGNAVAFLCSEYASFCVGSALIIDGGQGRVFPSN